jgi:hypothetical protein
MPNENQNKELQIQSSTLIRDDIHLVQFVFPGLTKPALACPVLDTGYLISGNPVFFSFFA